MLFSAFRLLPLTVARGGNESFSSKIQPQATMFEYFHRNTLTPSVLLPPFSFPLHERWAIIQSFVEELKLQIRPSPEKFRRLLYFAFIVGVDNRAFL